jgi:threonine synthase
LYSGLRDLHTAGLLERMPRLWAVEPFPRLTRVLQGAPLQSEFDGSTAQFSIAGSTVTLQQQLAVRYSGGGVVVADDTEAADGVAQLGAESLWVELCVGGCVSAITRLCKQGRILPTDHVLLVMTAKGDRDTFDHPF